MKTDAASTPRPTPWQVGRELGAVVADVPRFVGAPLFRTRHLRWGATPAEVTDAMPGDGWVSGAQYRTTRAITIDAPREAVWPWLVQVGCLRAGFYSDDLLDNLAHPSATSVIPELQHRRIGQWVPMSPGEPSDRTAFKVASFVENESLLWAKPDSTWSWRLTELPGGRTRLVTRVRARYDWSHPSDAALGVLLMELGDFAMMRRMLRGIKERAESLATGLSEHSDVATESVWGPWARAWLGVLAWAFVNGGLHRAYEPLLGALPAEQLSNATLLAAVIPWAIVVEQRHPLTSREEALKVGALWGTLTVAFEFVGGHYLNGDSWRTLLDAYDLTAGHLWPLAVCGIVVAPVLARTWRLARTAPQRGHERMTS